ncbi:uncharacterized protein EDB93DRAFT_848560 [Suillus bovinus]|uniref:uncharacterized protein n=1 Tax=Suillus bovinus TaxID=48563 RepID=UPI001B874F4E|nr:uncharacterized protein EDB93DRAFT_848560 [Suillus bovinus]KAG2134154.1 hypothetical protein EDB93DRAFT_848560 [Suillus bovinus]
MHASFFTARLVALATIASVVSAQTNSELPAGCDSAVAVRAGDTCDTIAAENNVSTYQLSAVNKIIDPGCDNLAVGEVLCLGIKGQDCKVTYILKPSDTCFSVAEEYGIPLSTLLANNPNVGPDCTKAYAGEVLCTASQIYVNTTTSN